MGESGALSCRIVMCQVSAGTSASHLAFLSGPSFTKEIVMPAMLSSPYLLPILMLIGSNVFMTTARYWHLRFKEVPLFGVILLSWGLAFIEYCLAVPANRWGNAVYSAAQLKTMQEVITLTVIAIFSVVYLHQALNWNHAVGFGLIAAGAFFVFRGPL
jgi:uncharacterized protein (DUF486 family)